jgi:DHA1 family bicyclomycin/chloramphenicol resistance-like MFS transporter
MLLALGLIGILGPFGTDVYLPGLPVMAQELHTTPATIRLTLSAYTLGMALGQLVVGSLSDRWGRRRLMIGGGLSMALASLWAGTTMNVWSLLLACLMMGISSAAGLITGRAVIADRTQGREATRAFSLLQMTVSSGPIFGPAVGAALLAWGGWRLVFIMLAGFAACGSLAVTLLVPESLPREKRTAHSFSETFRIMGRILREPQFLSFAATIWFGFAMLFGYISSSAFIFQNTLGLSPQLYALDFSANGCGLVIAGIISAALARRVRGENIVLFGLCIQVVGMFSLLMFFCLNAISLWTIVPSLFIIVTSMGFVFGPGTAAAITRVRYASGTALALLGSLQFVAAAVSSWATSAVSPAPLLGFLIVGVTCTAISLSTAIFGKRLSSKIGEINGTS